jgi:hypothetical protein
MGSQISTDSDFYEGSPETTRGIKNPELVTQKADSFVDQLRQKTDEAILNKKENKQKIINRFLATEFDWEYYSEDMFSYIRTKLLDAARDGKCEYNLILNFNKYSQISMTTKDLLVYDHISDFYHRVDNDETLHQSVKTSILNEVLIRELSYVLEKFAMVSKFNYYNYNSRNLEKPYCEISMSDDLKADQGTVCFHFIWTKIE